MPKADPEVMLSLVVPMLDEAPVVGQLLSGVEKVFSQFGAPWELIAVEDGSADRTWELLKQARTGRPWLRAIRLARSFGQHPATFAGMEAARGEIIAVMDADLQIHPEDIKGLAERVRGGVDLAFAVRDHVGEGWLRGAVGPAVNRFLARHSAGAPREALSTFLAAKAGIVAAALGFEVRPPVTPFHVMLGGGREIVWVSARNAPRDMGRSKYGLWRLFKLTLDTFFGYTDLAPKAMAAVAAAAPGGALPAWALAWLCSLAGWGGLAAVLLVAGASWALVCLAVLVFMVGQVAMRRGGPAGPLYIVAESF